MDNRILIVGLSAGGAATLSSALLERVTAADLLAGGQRQLGYFPDYDGETMAITTQVEPLAQRLQQGLADGQQAVVLASGDPLCYGIGASLRRFLPAEALEIIPAPTAFQMAFAALAEPWSEAALLSAHARPLAQVVTAALAAPKAAILTDHRHTPGVIARALLKAGLAPQSACAICENLGGAEERVVRTTLARVEQESYAPLNVFVVWPTGDAATQSGVRVGAAGPIRQSGDRQPSASKVTGTSPRFPKGLGHPQPQQPDDLTLEPQPGQPIPPGLPDQVFSTSAGQITKREIRLLSLAELALGAGEIMWDIGAGSGAVGLEAARAQPAAAVYAVEKRPEMARHLQQNLRRFPAPNFQWVEGMAPEAVAGWPDPDALFIGGSGGRLEALIELAQQRLRPGGRLVINLATLENLNTARTHLPEARVIQVQISRGVPILEMLRFEALNPVFIVTWRNR